MGWLEFIARIVESLAWPAALIILLLLLREHLLRIPSYIRKAKYKDFEITFGDSIDIVESDADIAGIEVPKDLPNEYNELLQNNKNRLHVVVIEAWAMIERELVQKVRKSKEGNKKLSVKAMGKILRERNFLSEEEVELLNSFLQTRHRAVHEEIDELKEEDVVDFLRVAAALLEHIKKIPDV
jgi:hypothetical protein